MTPNTDLQTLADAYNASIGLPAPIRGHYEPIDHRIAHAICEAYEKLPILATDDLTRATYQALANEVMQQFRFLADAGYDFEPWQLDGQPYQNSAEMMADVCENKHIFFFTGGEPNPYMTAYAVTLYGVECSVNDVFRAVHDLFGHACEGFGFGQRGEENAWIHHSMMFTAGAQWALTTETRGQNSWVNENEANKHLPACNKPFATQKAALLSGTWSRIPDHIAVAWQGYLI